METAGLVALDIVAALAGPDTGLVVGLELMLAAAFAAHIAFLPRLKQIQEV